MLVQALLLTCFVAAGLTETTYECPSSTSDNNNNNNVEVFGQNCFEFVVNKRKYFFDAEDYCEDNGGTLAIVPNEDINNFIADTLMTKFNVLSKPVWIGLWRDETYKWVNGSSLGNYDKFASRWYYDDFDCVAIIPESGLWHDYKCEQDHYGRNTHRNMFICQYPAHPVTTTTALTTTTPKSMISIDDCPKSVLRDKYLQVFGNKCYMFEMETFRDFESADAYCQSGGGRLATIDSAELNNFIESEFYHTYNLRSRTAWIGLRYEKHQEDHFWLDGAALSFMNFRHNSFYTYEECVSISARDGKWLNNRCAYTYLPFVCEFMPTEIITTTPPPTSTKKAVINSQGKITREDCPVKTGDEKDLQVLGNKCYYFGLDDEKSFDKAERFCESFNGTLALVKTKEINSFLQHHLIETHDRVLSHYRYWIGLRYEHQNGYRWVDGSPLTNHNFRYEYFDGQCVTLNAVSGVWGEDTCYSDYLNPKARLGFICEFEAMTSSKSFTTTPMIDTTPTTVMPTTTTVTTTTATTTSATTTTPIPTKKMTREDCPVKTANEDDLQVLGSVCYYFALIREETFGDAEHYCERYGGTLALVKTDEINYFIRHHLTQTHNKMSPTDRYWIGLRYKYPNGYHWVDETPLTSHNMKHPNPQKQCVTFNALSGMWDEDICYIYSHNTRARLGFICEFKATRNSGPSKPLIGVIPSTTTTTKTTVMPTKTTSSTMPTTTTTMPTTTTTMPTTTTTMPTTTTTMPTTTTTMPTTTTTMPTMTTTMPTTTTTMPTTTTTMPTTTTIMPTTSSTMPTTTTTMPTTTTTMPTTTTTMPTTTATMPTTTTTMPTTTTTMPTTTTTMPTTTTTTSMPTTTTSMPTTTTTMPTTTTTTKPTTTTTTKPTTMSTTMLTKTTTTMPTTTTTIIKPTTTTPMSTSTNKEVFSSVKPTCPEIFCDLDCGMDGYKVNQQNGCMVCDCDT